jgi:hypothetical protein
MENQNHSRSATFIPVEVVQLDRPRSAAAARGRAAKRGGGGKAAGLTAEAGITYAAVNASVTCLAHHLLDRGLRPGDRAAVHWSTVYETYVSFHFCVIALFFTAHLLFIRSDNFLRPAAVNLLPVCAGRPADCG